MARKRAEAERTSPNGSGPALPPPATTLVDVPIAQIRMGPTTQGRLRVCPEIVAEYADAMRDGADFPPVTVFYDGETYWMADGYHRGEAAQQAGHTTILAEVHNGGEREARFFAAGANRTHGLRRNVSDKERAVLFLLNDEEWGQWSDREIARHCGVSHPFVGKLRAQRATGNVTSERTYITKHGTIATMDTSRIGAHEATPRPMNGAPTAGTRTPRRHGPAPLSAEAQERRRWYYLTAGLLQVIADFAHRGGVTPLLEVWSVAERAAARAQLAQHRDQIDRLDAAIAALDSPTKV